jgi:uncharacterized protein YukE
VATFGVEIDALRAFAQQMDQRSRDMRATMQRLTAGIEQLNWVGSDRDRFVDGWRNQHLPNLGMVVADLGDAVAEAMRHATAQEQASLA